MLSGACVWGYQLSWLGWVFWWICLWRGLHAQVATLAEIGLLWVHLGDSTSSLALDAWRPAFVAQCRPGAYLVRQRFLSIAPRLCWFQHGLGFLCKRRRVIISSRRWREHGFWLSRLDRRSWTTSVTRRIHHRRRRSDMASRRCSHLAQSTFGIGRHQNSTCSILHAVHGIQILLVGILVLVLQFFYISYSIHVASHRLYHLIRSTLVLIFINDWNIFFIVCMLWAFLFHLDGCDEFVSQGDWSCFSSGTSVSTFGLSFRVFRGFCLLIDVEPTISVNGVDVGLELQEKLVCCRIFEQLLVCTCKS